MSELPVIKPYKKAFDYTYVSGAFAVYELLSARPTGLRAVCIHSSYDGSEKLTAVCKNVGKPVIRDDRVFTRLGLKDNCLVFAVMDKYSNNLDLTRNHVVLTNPSDMGNLGTITRSMASFGFLDLAVVLPAADIFDPKTIRASMGALFRINVQFFDNFDNYLTAFPNHEVYLFMTDGETALPDAAVNIDRRRPFTLVFGSEADGLPSGFKALGKSVHIPQTGMTDSLNLSVAAGIAFYAFSL